MDQFETLHGISGDELPPTIGSIGPVGDFHSAARRGRFDAERQAKRGGHSPMAEPAAAADDEVVLSDVANVSLLAEEGLSASAIAADLGLTAAEVMTDLGIAAEIRDSLDDAVNEL